MIGWILDAIPWWLWLLIVGLPVSALVVIYWPIMLAIWNALPPWARWLLGGLVAAALAYLKGRDAGRDKAREAQRKRDAEAVGRRQQIDRQTSAMPDDAVQKELKDKWSRD